MIVTGKAFWASVQRPNTTYKPVFSIKLELDAENAAAVEAAGLRTKTLDGKKFVTFSKSAVMKDGTPAKPPIVLTAAKQPFSDLIGNGSLVRVQVRVYEHKPQTTKLYGITHGAELQGVQVIELVPYSSASDSVEFDVEDGFVVKDSVTDTTSTTTTESDPTDF